jgi:hypothetical protein
MEINSTVTTFDKGKKPLPTIFDITKKAKCEFFYQLR